MKPAQLVLLLAANMAFATGCSSTADSLSGTASVAEAYGPDTVTCRHVIITGTRIGTMSPELKFAFVTPDSRTSRRRPALNCCHAWTRCWRVANGLIPAWLRE